MKVYLAGASATEEIERIKKWSEALKADGLEIYQTQTWMSVISSVGTANPKDVSAKQRGIWSAKDLAEVREADLIWGFVPVTAPGRGMYYETGFADALEKHLILSGDSKQSIFCARGIEFVQDQDAFNYICAYAKRTL